MSSSQPFFLNSEGRQIFALRDDPSGAMVLREGVVICPPAPHEIKKLHWTMRQLAIRLTQTGYTSLRFDYFGSGDSEGRGRDHNVPSCISNVKDAILWLKKSGDVRRITVIAPRISALFALAALREERVRRLVLVDPVLDPHMYLSEQDALHSALLRDDPSRAPFPVAGSSHRQRLGFYQDEPFRQQLKTLRPQWSDLKIKALHLVNSHGYPNRLSPADSAQLQTHLDEVVIKNSLDDLRWQSYQALQFQDFANQTIESVIQSVRGEA